jgi:hypothetical protein
MGRFGVGVVALLLVALTVETASAQLFSRVRARRASASCGGVRAGVLVKVRELRPGFIARIRERRQSRLTARRAAVTSCAGFNEPAMVSADPMCAPVAAPMTACEPVAAPVCEVAPMAAMDCPVEAAPVMACEPMTVMPQVMLPLYPAARVEPVPTLSVPLMGGSCGPQGCSVLERPGLFGRIRKTVVRFR